MNAIEDHPCELGGSPPAWRVLGFSAANPARELGDAGVLPLLMLLMLLERAPRLAARLLASSLGIPMQSNAVAEVDGQQQIELQQQQEARLPPFSLAEVAVEVTGWTLRVLGSGALNSEAQRLGSASGAAGERCVWVWVCLAWPARVLASDALPSSCCRRGILAWRR